MSPQPAAGDIAIRPDIHTCPFGCATETEGKPMGPPLISRQTAIVAFPTKRKPAGDTPRPDIAQQFLPTALDRTNSSLARASKLGVFGGHRLPHQKPHPPTRRLLSGVAKSKPQISDALKRRRICGCPTRWRVCTKLSPGDPTSKSHGSSTLQRHSADQFPGSQGVALICHIETDS
jgi:hypothetical protein